MRLSAIKLAGFKSFVDATSLQLPSNLTGVVGPNGCGKSNVIDAIRWVMGESSAKQLRGEAMEDVIFNGSKARKPVGRASVELIFDNSDHSIGGQFANYAEISVRRELSRDGTSLYFLNGSRCRRRDITDLFLGTGLGTRGSYAIIEQGTVSRLIEAKPEEMRQIFEEAAGISKYKERRRETENRIRHTRENLDRLNDLRGELTARLEQLKRQAENAEKFKEFKKEERKLKAETLALRWRELEGEAARRLTVIDEQTAEMETLRGKSSELEARRTEMAQDQHRINDALQGAQAEFYAAEADVSRVDQALLHARELKTLKENELAGIEQHVVELNRRIESENARCGELRTSIQSLEGHNSEAESTEAEVRAQVLAAEKGVEVGEERLETFARESEAPLRQTESERTRVEQIDQRLQENRTRMERIASELAGIATEAMVAELEKAEADLAELGNQLQTGQLRFDEDEKRWSSLRDRRAEIEGSLHEAREGLQSSRGRLASLEALQQAALGQDDEVLQGWLGERSWADRDRLARIVDVEPGWERATEAVLGHLLQAVCVRELSNNVRHIEDWPTTSVALVDPDTDAGSVRSGSLAERIKAPAALKRFVAHVQTASGAADALQQAATLNPGETVVTRDGVVYGRGWTWRPHSGHDEAGVVAREKEIKALTADVERFETRGRELQSQLDGIRNELRELDELRATQRRELESVRSRHSECLAFRESQSVRVEQARRRGGALQTELVELKEAVGRHEQTLSVSRRNLSDMETKANRLNSDRQTLQDELRKRRQALIDARQKQDEASRSRQAVHIDLAGRRTALQAAEQAIVALQEQVTALDGQRGSLGESMATLLQPITLHEQTRGAALQRRGEAEKGLQTRREQLAGLERQVADLNQQHQQLEQKIDAVRDRLQQARLDHQALDVRRQTISEQLSEGGFELEALIEGLDETASATDWELRLEKVERRISRLGAINLAAIEEFDEQQEREQYLETQYTDLNDALETLESAIRKIDRETRTRFKETFDKAAMIFRERFPKLFGGGEAYIELTGEDLLETGVRVMARPPGKRNSSIQMLSGGEKAMTAVALLLALFELNPAPFCLMDEVDAPLDDANVIRFCNVINEMAKHVQFIIITHNKITMELAQQLHGVTMQEPGVSRLVSVDVDQAIEMAS